MRSRSVLLIYTGGTIGMTAGPAGLAPDAGFADTISSWIERWQPSLRFSVRSLDPLIDSADAAPAHWHAIASAILEAHAGFDGIVVLHGTDTMAYTASALSFLLQGLAKPIVLTGAQVPFATGGSDAESNLRDALTWALDERVREVSIVFDGTLLRGNRSVKFSTRIGDSFASPHWPALACSRPLPVLNETALLRPQPALPRLPPAPPSTNAVGLVKVYPGLSDRILLAAGEAHAHGIILELYGSGTAPALNSTLRAALEQLARREIPVVGVSQCVRGAVVQPLYVSSRVLRDAGVIFGHDLTPEAALTKLSFLRGTGHAFSALAGAMARDLAGEISVSANAP